ncbi:AsmA family protein [Methylobacterium oryzihabitans]|uniref:AsmA family protein n=1 Tax=Methylobacterium oryzihabitans TaxID=2499852 RepID=A0A437NY52_9HYPH|nr:AsmA-like C-terminal region-containing protein [Methylobacterium oryzihabitans]RVU14953.1 AsmA family protein [Methylobacterium oryzihabitans]
MRLRNLLLILAAGGVAGAAALLVAGEGLIVRAAAGRLEAATGRSWVVGGAGLSLRPAGLVLYDLATETPPGPVGRARLTIEAVRFTAAALGLLAGEADEVELVRPALHWPAQWWRGDETLRGPALSPGHAPRVARLTVREGRIALTEGERTVAALDGLAVAAARQAGGYALTVAGRTDGTPVRCTLTTAPVDPPPVPVDPPPVPADPPPVAGRPPGDAEALAVTFSCRVPPVSGAPIDGAAEAVLTGSTLTLSRLSGSLGSDRFGGSALVDLARKPFVRLDLGFEALSVAAPPETGALGTAAVLRLFDGRMRLRAASLAMGRTRLDGVDLDLRLADGAVEAALAPAGLHGGRVQGRLAATLAAAPEDEPRHALLIELARVRALPLLSGLAGFSLVDGAATATLDLRAGGRDLAGIRRSLSGTAALLVENGRFNGADIPGMVQSMAARISAADTTAFDRLSLRFRIDDGRATTQDLAFAGPLVTAGGSGVVDLVERGLAFRIEPRLTGAAARALPRLFDVSLPILVNGPWDAPQVHVDLAGLMSDGRLQQGLGTLGTDLLGGRGGGLLDALVPAEGAGRAAPRRR